MFKITKQWLTDNSTSRGGHNAKQLQILGCEWPPPKRWRQIYVGAMISLEGKRRFEEAATVKKSPLSSCLSLIKKLNNDDLALMAEACKASIESRKNRVKL